MRATLGERSIGVWITGDTDVGITVTAGMVGTLAETATDRCAQRVTGC